MIVRSEIIDKDSGFRDSNLNKFTIWTIKTVDTTGREKILKVITDSNLSSWGRETKRVSFLLIGIIKCIKVNLLKMFLMKTYL